MELQRQNSWLPDNVIKYLNEINTDELINDIRLTANGNGKIFKEICKILIAHFDQVLPEHIPSVALSGNTSFNKIFNLSRNIYLNFPLFSNTFQEWRKRRLSTMETLISYDKQFAHDRRMTAKNRLIFSSLDIVCLLGGCYLQRSESDWASSAFQASTVFSVMGCGNSDIYEKITLKKSKTLILEITNKFNHEELVFRKIREFFEEVCELTNAWQEVLPLVIGSELLETLEHNASHRAQMVAIFEELFKAFVSSDPSIIGKPNFILNVFEFATSHESHMSLSTIGSFLREKALLLDSFSILLSNNRLMDNLSHCTHEEAKPSPVRYVAAFWQPPFKILMAAKIALSAFSVYKALCDNLRNVESPLSQVMIQVKSELQSQLDVLTKVHDDLRSYYDNNVPDQIPA